MLKDRLQKTQSDEHHLQLTQNVEAMSSVPNQTELAQVILPVGEVSKKITQILSSLPNQKSNDYISFSLMQYVEEREKLIENAPPGQRGPLAFAENSDGHHLGAKVAYYRLRQVEILAQDHPEMFWYLNPKVDQLLQQITTGRTAEEKAEKELASQVDRPVEKMAELLQLLTNAYTWLNLPQKAGDEHEMTDMQLMLRFLLFFPIEQTDRTNESLLMDFLVHILEFQGRDVQNQSLARTYELMEKRSDHFGWFDSSSVEAFIRSSDQKNAYYFRNQIKLLQEGIAQIQKEIVMQAKEFTEHGNIQKKSKRSSYAISFLYWIIDLLEGNKNSSHTE